jgi:hypothetical protein
MIKEKNGIPESIHLLEILEKNTLPFVIVCKTTKTLTNTFRKIMFPKS